MKQFNLEEYLANPNRKVITRRGNKVRIVCTNRKNENYPIVALIQDSTGNYEDTHHYTINGKWVNGETNLSDLFFAPEKKEGWINLYEFNLVIVPGTKVYDTKEKAKFEIGNKSKNYISTIKVECEE